MNLLFQSVDPRVYVMWVALCMFSICCHEFAHAATALWQGDTTARDAGHLTLNPLRQMGFFSIAMLLIFGIAWGAVPVRPELMRRRYSHALVSAAGPGANVLLFLVFGFLAALVFRVGSTVFSASLQPIIVHMFSIGASLNIVLAILNLIPLPVLDGWVVFSYFIPRLRRVSPELQSVLNLIMIVLLVSGGFGFITRVAGPIVKAYFRVLQALPALSNVPFIGQG